MANTPVRPAGHSFFLAATLEHLCLVFDPSPLDRGAVVFDTEAPPLRRTWTP